MRYNDLLPSAQVVYIIGFSAEGFVRRKKGAAAAVSVVVLQNKAEDATVLEVDGGDDQWAKVQVFGSGITWGWSGIDGRRQAINRLITTNIWVKAGEIDGAIKHPKVTIHKAIAVDPASDEVTANG